MTLRESGSGSSASTLSHGIDLSEVARYPSPLYRRKADSHPAPILCYPALPLGRYWLGGRDSLRLDDEFVCNSLVVYKYRRSTKLKEDTIKLAVARLSQAIFNDRSL